MRYLIKVLLILAGVGFVQPVAGSERVALVVGNASYQTSPLANPVNDANDMARTLEGAGFEVTLLTDATRSDLRRGIREFRKKLPKSETGLFYYAGHGIQYRGDNYLVPVDAVLQEEFEIPDETVSAYTILRAMEEASNPLNVVILDACRNNPFSQKYRSQDRGLARMWAPSGSIIAYATAPGNVAIDGEGRNGLYTKHLLNAIESPGLSLEEVFKQVRRSVVDETGGKQTPWEESSLTGDFYFISDNSSSDPSTVASIAPVNEIATSSLQSNPREFDVWNGIKDSKRVEDFQLFLEMFPQGVFAPFAKRRVQALSEPTMQGSGIAGSAPVESIDDAWPVEGEQEAAPAKTGEAELAMSTPQARVKELNEYALTVNALPRDASVRILNIKPRYQPGIRLQPGRYHVSVSKASYETENRWVTIVDADQELSITLGEKRKGDIRVRGGRVKSTVDMILEKDPGLQDFFDSAYGFVIFPGVAKGGLGIGGAYGKGEVYEQGRYIGRAKLTQLTIGFQLGGQKYSEVIFFKNKRSLDEFTGGRFKFSAQASAVAVTAGASADAAYNHDVVIFTMTQGGLMYEASIGGQKFSFKRE